jgi:hypothetical protein
MIDHELCGRQHEVGQCIRVVAQALFNAVSAHKVGPLSDWEGEQLEAQADLDIPSVIEVFLIEGRPLSDY